MPYFPSARGVLPPLWSRAAIKPGEEEIRFRCSTFRVAAPIVAVVGGIVGVLGMPGDAFVLSSHASLSAARAAFLGVVVIVVLLPGVELVFL